MLNSSIEIWKPIKGYENYVVSNYGRVKSLKKDIILKHWNNNSGYQVVKLNRKGKLVHRLVAIAFLENNDNLQHVDHIDNNKDNNCVSNLQWVTPSYNIQKAYRDNRHDLEKHKSYIGRKHARSTTKYFNVSKVINRYNGKEYISYKGEVANNGKKLEPKKFKTPEEAALHVNYIIDKYKLDRPKNILDKRQTTIPKGSTLK